MIHCSHRHPQGETYCPACQQEKAVESERIRIFNLLNHRKVSERQRIIAEELERIRKERE